MLAGSGGAIVNTATTFGPPGSDGPAAYHAAEAGLIALTRQIAGEYGPHVRANVIASGPIDPDDVARVALFLAGDASAYISRRGHPVRRRPRGTSMSATTRVIVVTGGASGLGEAIVSRLRLRRRPRGRRRRRRAARARQVADNLTAAGLPAESETVDVTSEGEVAAMFDAIAERHGRLDALVCAAAVEARSSVVDCTDDEWQRVLDVNLKGPFLCCKHGIPAIASSGGGAVVLLGSVLGAIGSPGYAAYCASKGALANLAKQAAIEQHAPTECG